MSQQKPNSWAEAVKFLDSDDYHDHEVGMNRMADILGNSGEREALDEEMIKPLAVLSKLRGKNGFVVYRDVNENIAAARFRVIRALAAMKDFDSECFEMCGKLLIAELGHNRRYDKIVSGILYAIAGQFEMDFEVVGTAGVDNMTQVDNEKWSWVASKVLEVALDEKNKLEWSEIELDWMIQTSAIRWFACGLRYFGPPNEFYLHKILDTYFNVDGIHHHFGGNIPLDEHRGDESTIDESALMTKLQKEQLAEPHRLEKLQLIKLQLKKIVEKMKRYETLLETHEGRKLLRQQREREKQEQEARREIEQRKFGQNKIKAKLDYAEKLRLEKQQLIKERNKARAQKFAENRKKNKLKSLL